jgi:putative MATE family efflux protein
MNSNTTENKMGTMPVGRLLLNMALPMMISMLVQALYNVVDSIFVSRISEDALTAVSLAYPVQNIMISVGTGVGVGMNALLSRALGQKKQNEVNSAATNGWFLAMCGYLIFLVIGLFFTRAFFRSQTDIESIVEYGHSYLSICCIVSFGFYLQTIFERMLQSTGHTMYSMITQMTGAIINIILDPILIFGYFGAPRLGIAGAAVATVFGQCVAAALAVIFNMKKNPEIHFTLKGFRPSLYVIKKILSVGVPSILMVSIGSIMNFGMNKILLTFTSTAAAVFGVYFKLQSFVFMPVFGLNNGMVPILSYNYGARHKDRIIQTIKYSILFAVVIMLCGLITAQLIPDKMLLLFNASESMLSIGVPALRTITLSFVFAGFCIVVSSVFQAFGNGIYSMLLSFIRQIVVLLPVAYLFSLTGVLDYVWFAFPIAEIFAVGVSTLLLRRLYKKTIRSL